MHAHSLRYLVLVVIDQVGLGHSSLKTTAPGSSSCW